MHWAHNEMFLIKNLSACKKNVYFTPDNCEKKFSKTGDKL